MSASEIMPRIDLKFGSPIWLGLNLYTNVSVARVAVDGPCAFVTVTQCRGVLVVEIPVDAFDLTGYDCRQVTTDVNTYSTLKLGDFLSDISVPQVDAKLISTPYHEIAINNSGLECCCDRLRVLG